MNLNREKKRKKDIYKAEIRQRIFVVIEKNIEDHLRKNET